MAKKSSKNTRKIQNRRARYDYELGDEIVAGIVLSGKETKALRLGHGHLRGAYVTLKDGEVWLINATITSFPGATIDESDQTRSRKLLLKKREIQKLESVKQQGNTIVPLELLTGGRFIKVRIASGRGKKRYDKRQVLKARDDKRAASSAFKSRKRLS
jgi:SsrA-binding protein